MAQGFRSLVIRVLALWNDLGFKQIGAKAGMAAKKVTEILGRPEVSDEHFEVLTASAARRPAEVQVVSRCFEELAKLREAGDVSDAELEEVERGVREMVRLARRVFLDAARLSRGLPPLDVYPRPEHLAAARLHAEMLWAVLAEMTEGQRMAVVCLCREAQTWWLMERVARESVEEAARDLGRAASLAQLAVEIAGRVQGPEGWCRRVVAYAAAHPPYVQWMAGDLREARAGLESARRCWEAGEDPGGVLDPGRLTGSPAVGVEPEAVVGCGLPAVGVEPDAVVEAGGGGQEGREEGDCEEDLAHGGISGAAPAADLHGPRGARLPAILREKAEKFPGENPVDGGLTFLQRLARLCRALSGLSQLAFGAKTGIDHILLARYERGKSDPSLEHVRCLAEGVDLTVEEGGEVLRFADTLRRPAQRPGLGREALLQEAGALGSRLAERLLRLPLGGPTPRAEDREHAAVLWARLQELPEDRQLAVVCVGREFQSWALAERCCEESFHQASRRLDRAGFLARLAREIAERVPGPEGWRNCLTGFAAAHLPNVRRVEGALGASREGLEEAKRLHRAGADPYGLLDPGRLLDLEASLCRDERDFPGALALHSEALPVSHHPGRSLVNKGYTLEVMGDYEGALEVLLAAEPLVDREADPRLRYKHRANLAAVCAHVGRYTEAADAVREARELMATLGNEIDEIRLTGIEGRIAVGLGRQAEALRLLRHASREFAARNMWYSVALADLEIAGLLLAEGRTAEVRAMAHELVEAFESRGVHVEAAKALRLFKQAVERDEAPPELAGRVLHYLFRAEHQPELAFAA